MLLFLSSFTFWHMGYCCVASGGPTNQGWGSQSQMQDYGEQGKETLFPRPLGSVQSINPFPGKQPRPQNAFPRRQHQGALILAPYCLEHTVRQPEWRAGWEYAPTPWKEERGRRFAVVVLNRCSKCKYCSC